MSQRTIDGAAGAHRKRIEAIRSEADSLLKELDASNMVEAAALLASAIDAIDTSLQTLGPDQGPDNN